MLNQTKIIKMKRRELFKKMGIASVSVFMGSTILSSTKAMAQDTQQNKLIANRQKMSFADPKNPTKFELKHTPDISFGEKDPNGFTKVSITIGQTGIIHPTEENHWIDFLNIYKNDHLVSKMLLENGPIRGYADHYINLKSGDLLKVEIGCNLHGIWENTETFRV